MTADPRAALDRFVAALEGHLHAVETRRAEDDPAVDDAYEVLADAFDEDDDDDDDEDDEDDDGDPLDAVDAGAR
jgi:hypothetical protein